MPPVHGPRDRFFGLGSRYTAHDSAAPVTPPNAACPGRKLGRAKKLTGVKRGPTFESALVVSAPKGGEPDGMHRGSQVYQIAEEIDFSVGGRIMTRARGKYICGHMYYDCSRRLSCACRVWYTVAERLRELVAFSPKERLMNKIEDNDTIARAVVMVGTRVGVRVRRRTTRFLSNALRNFLTGSMRYSPVLVLRFFHVL